MPAKRDVRWAMTHLAWTATRVRDGYRYVGGRVGFAIRTRGLPVHRVVEPIGERTRHTYSIAGGEAFTTAQMQQRWRIVERLYPARLTSLLDIGCCRGWFVVNAAMRPECERASGVDVVQGFIDAANDAKRVLKLGANVTFDYAFLDDVANDAARFRTPYQTIVLLNTYHYMFWGRVLREALAGPRLPAADAGGDLRGPRDLHEPARSPRVPGRHRRAGGGAPGLGRAVHRAAVPGGRGPLLRRRRARHDRPAAVVPDAQAADVSNKKRSRAGRARERSRVLIGGGRCDHTATASKSCANRFAVRLAALCLW